MSNRGSADDAVCRITVLKRLGLREHSDLRGDRQYLQPTRRHDVCNELHRIHCRFDLSSRDQEGDLPKGHIAGRESAVRAIQRATRARRKALRLYDVVD